MLLFRTRRWIGLSALVFSLLFSTLSQATPALPSEDADWKLARETDNINIYTAPLEGSRFSAFKAVAVLDAPLTTLMAVMVNPHSCVEWVLNCKEAYTIGEGNFHDRYAYSSNRMPWPVTDRDYVLRIQTRGDEASGEITMIMSAITDMRETRSGHIRVEKSDTFYRFEAINHEQTRMTWLQHTDPNGALPGWLVNSLLVDIPLKSLQQLEQVAQRDYYQHHQLVYDDEGLLIGVAKSQPAGND